MSGRGRSDEDLPDLPEDPSPTGYVLQNLGLVTGHPDPYLGMYVQEYDPDGHGGRGEVVWTHDTAEALHFASQDEAIACWQQVSGTHPTRPWDGKPNRPLTAFSVMTVPVR